MKKLQHITRIFCWIFVAVSSCVSIAAAESNTIEGMWTTIDDETQKPKSHLKIWIENGTLNGEIVSLIDSSESNPLCHKCSGGLHNKPIVGLNIMWGLKLSGNDWWDGGKIVDPNNGKVYRCKVRLIDNGERLEVRGYVGFSMFGRSQTWHRKSSE